MNINSIPQRRRGTGSSVILSPEMSMQVNKQMRGTRINGAGNNAAGTRGDGGGKTGAQWCLKGILRTEHSGLVKIRLSKIYWRKTVHSSDSPFPASNLSRRLLFCDEILLAEEEKGASASFISVQSFSFIAPQIEITKKQNINFRSLPSTFCIFFFSCRV